MTKLEFFKNSFIFFFFKKDQVIAEQFLLKSMQTSFFFLLFMLRTLYNTDTHTSTCMCPLKDFKLADGYFRHNLTQYKCSPPPPPYSFLKVARFFSIR